MRNIEPCPPSAETHRPSRPNWVTSGQFPETSRPENHALFSESQGDDATRRNNINVLIRTLPPYSTANRQMTVPLPTEFENLDAQMNSVPTESPPTYDQMFAPKYANTQETATGGTSLGTNLNSSEEGRTFVRRTVNVHERGNNPDNPDDGESTVTACAKCVMMIPVAIVLVVLKVLLRHNWEG